MVRRAGARCGVASPISIAALISQKKPAERYLDAFAAVDDDTTLEELITRLQKHTIWRGHRVRALRPFADDSRCWPQSPAASSSSAGSVTATCRPFFFPSPAKSPREARRRSAWITRQLRLLRAHGLITKIPGTHRYLLTPSGRKITAQSSPRFEHRSPAHSPRRMKIFAPGEESIG